MVDIKAQEIQFCCIRCKGNLERSKNILNCVVCGATYNIIDDIPSFLANQNNFYEGRWIQSYADEKDYKPSPLFLQRLREIIHKIYLSCSYSNRWKRFMKRMLSGANGRVLDLGCNGGIGFYEKIGPVAGIDLSLKALTEAKKIYTTICQGDIDNLPFPDESFDFVVSTLVLGHLTDKKKEKVYSEIKRVLKKGGLTIHVIETDGNSLKYLRHGNLWNRFKSHYGHDDMDPPIKAMQRFRDEGFIPITEAQLSCHIIPLGNISQNLTEEIIRDLNSLSMLFGLLIRLDKLISRHRVMYILTDYLLNILADIDNLFSSVNQAMVIGVCYKKA